MNATFKITHRTAEFNDLEYRLFKAVLIGDRDQVKSLKIQIEVLKAEQSLGEPSNIKVYRTENGSFVTIPE